MDTYIIKKGEVLESRTRLMAVTAMPVSEKIKTLQFLPLAKNEITLIGCFPPISREFIIDAETDERDGKTYITNFWPKALTSLSAVVKMLSRASTLKPDKLRKVAKRNGLSETLLRIEKGGMALEEYGISVVEADSLCKLHTKLVRFSGIVQMLNKHNLDPFCAYLAYSKEISPEMIESNPYCLYLEGIYEDFQALDRIYISAANWKLDWRCQMTIRGVIRKALGVCDTYVDLREIQGEMEMLMFNDGSDFPFSSEFIRKQIDVLVSNHIISENTRFGCDALSDYLVAAMESRTAVNISRFLSTKKSFDAEESEIDNFLTGYESKKGIILNKEQHEAVQSALTTSFSVITGKAGTGKTCVLDAICQGILALNSEAIIIACAPTGKAAQRMSESIGRNAKTIHKVTGQASIVIPQ